MKKVLFVCRQNIGRSQMAKAFYNAMTQTSDADAAGTSVQFDGQTLQERKEASRSNNFFVLDVMKDAGIDMSGYVRNILQEESLVDYDKVICMANKDCTPGWLLESPKYVHWDVKDPRGQDYATTAKVRDVIKAKVTDLIGT